MSRSSVIKTTNVGQRVTNFLRARHPHKTADHVAATSGCSRSQVLKWLERESVPNGLAMLRLAHAYGPEFLEACLGDHAPNWLRKGVIEAEIERTEREIADRRARHDELRAMLAK